LACSNTKLLTRLSKHIDPISLIVRCSGFKSEGRRQIYLSLQAKLLATDNCDLEDGTVQAVGVWGRREP
jgi:hypothetical protein